MTYSAVGLASEVSKGAAGTPEVVVEPGAGGEREELGRDPGTEAVQGSGVAFEFELVFESPEDRFDALADRCEMRAAAGLVGSSGREHDRVVALVDGGRELFAGVAFVGDDRLPATQADRQQSHRDVAFFLVCGSEDRRAGGAVRRGQEGRAHAPKPTAG